MIEIKGKVVEWSLFSKSAVPGNVNRVHFGVDVENSELEPLLLQISPEASQELDKMDLAVKTGLKGYLYVRISVNLSVEITDNGHGN